MTSGSRQVGGGTLFTEPFLVVSHRAGAAESGVRDQYGQPLGTVAEAENGTFRKALRMITGSARFRPNCFAVRDSGGSVVLKVRVHDSRFLVTRADGTPIGEIAPDGPHRFALSAHGRPVGALENRPPRDFRITGSAGSEVARAAEEPGRGYVVEVFAQLTDPLASLVIAAALTVETALRPR
ncbi:hypothetical protein L1857_10025 [Amycolatopsis thermalba]|uniref:Scramblase n=1 Tax=Amycolatopsis thermalba TaxID=944492 RepID=A0ABY4NSV9_9PSEU|nr:MULTISPECIES: hypothetical protein [Amycolatopsis]UQS23128.1 hypothetical protein L1857_10025 [Amycolatopsis thermalba]